ncbi:YcaO-like family protein [Shimia sp.]|jgi:ribosomal protein S12 methylthiotransferase accessory factor YcaO|uniref:YcaO-like family protein n=1 Tax=unclassified Shimia TaxID=2630038 RepID=UPI0025CE3DAB|nr:YcaO-like family protein [Shimia sp.]MCH2069333.1 YcaO-like family protein [Shimia sp.]
MGAAEGSAEQPKPNAKEANQLISAWTRQDWREVLTSPNLCVLQALVNGAATASGAGDTREDALECCLGETAEIQAHIALRETGQPPILTGQSGVAAHPDPIVAQRLAIFEAHERAAVWAWWLGQMGARPVSSDWLSRMGIWEWLKKLRLGAVQRRQTGVWLLDCPGVVFVAVSRAQGGTGQDPILGFGADTDPERAVRKALRETLLMELNLGEVLASRSGHSDQDTRAIEDKIAAYTHRCPALLGAEAEIEPASAQAITIEALSKGVTLRDITPAGQLRRVWCCTVQGIENAGLQGQDSPFM